LLWASPWALPAINVEIPTKLNHTTSEPDLTRFEFTLSQKWRNHTVETACTAVISHETILQQIPAEEKALTPPSSVFQARIHPLEWSPMMLRPRRSRNARSSCGSTDITVHEDPQSPSGSSDESSDIEIPSRPRTRTADSGIKLSHAINTSQALESDVPQRQYCAQTCLLGLVRRRPLDKASLPKRISTSCSRSWQLSCVGLEGLGATHVVSTCPRPDNGCEPLRKQGARGALFKLTLDSYGYTCVAKEPVRAFKANLKHEGLVYRHLTEVQGEIIPVYLGNFSLTYPYFLDVGVKIVHMLLMSWAGQQAQKDLMTSIGQDINVVTTCAMTKLRCHGVEHYDVRPPKIPKVEN
jgi:hypothetical protein